MKVHKNTRLEMARTLKPKQKPKVVEETTEEEIESSSESDSETQGDEEEVQNGAPGPSRSNVGKSGRTKTVEAIGKQIAMSIKNTKTEMLKELREEIAASVKRALTDSDLVQTTTEKIVKRARSNPVPEFKKKGNKQRFCANQEIIEKVETAMEDIGREDLTEAKKKLTEGKKIVTTQQKLIRMADRETDGWGVVNCYMADELADDTDDEKKIARSRREAAYNRKQQDGQISNKRRRNYRHNTYNFRNGYRRFENGRNERPKTQYREDRTKWGSCFGCGSFGHFKSEFPSQNRKY